MDKVTAFANNRTRVEVTVTNAQGVKRKYGGTKGLRVRRTTNDDQGYGKIGATVFMFKGTFDLVRATASRRSWKSPSP